METMERAPLSPQEIAQQIEAAATRVAAEKVARQNITVRRGRMMRGEGDGGYDASEAFYAALAIRLKLEEAPPELNVATMATDGERLYYDPVWTAGLNTERKNELHAVIVEEAMHCAHSHHARMPGECRTDSKAALDWNVACDLSIHSTMGQSGFTFPSCGHFVGKAPHEDKPHDLSSEQYYKLLRDDRSNNGGDAPYDGQEAPGGVLPCSTPEKAKQQAQSWKLAVAKAEQYAKERGEISAGLRRMLDGLLRPAYALAELLDEYITRISHDKANWNTRNRRYSDIYLPGKLNHTLGEIVLVLDCSGSITPAVLQKATQIAINAIEKNPARLTVLSHDADVTNEQVWEKGDEQLVIDPKGGGGTSHKPVFKRIAAMCDENPPDLVVCLTDCYTDYPTNGPECDVVWARFGGGGTKPPFGRMLDVEVN